MILTEDSIEQFLAYLGANGMSPHTIRAYRSDLKKLLERTGPITTREELELQAATALTAWRTEGDEPRTTTRRLASFRRFARWQGDPILAEYKAPTPAEPEPHPLPEGIPGVMLMLHAADFSKQRALISLCGLCGLRVQEARRVRPDDLYETPDGWMIHVRGKGAKDRKIPVSDTAYSFIKSARQMAKLENHETIVGMSDTTARETIYRLSRLVLGVSRPSHDLRATFATAAYHASGGDIRAVQRLLGHASVIQTQTYIGHSAAEMRRAAEVS